MPSSRRTFLAKSLLAPGLLLLDETLYSQDQPIAATAYTGYTVSIFSKSLQWMGVEEMAVTARQLGFDGIDLAVRPGGHVIPEQVATALPKAVAAIRKQGLEVYTIVTSITSAASPHTPAILQTASKLGIGSYRMGWIHYDKEQPISKSLARIRQELLQLNTLNKKYSITGAYQNHSGQSAEGEIFGAAIWDYYQAVHPTAPAFTGMQYDLYHAMAAGKDLWPASLALILPYIKSVTVKDWKWSDKGNGTVDTVPLGEGVVDYAAFFHLLKQHRIFCPVSMHYEYPLGGAEKGNATIEVSKEIVLDAMRKDLRAVKNILAAS